MNCERSAKKKANKRIKRVRVVESIGGAQARTGAEPTQSDQVCCWRVGKQRICGASIHSQDHLLKHLANVHCGSFSAYNGYFCDWKGCVEAKSMRYNTREALQEHARNHFSVSNVDDGDDTEYKADEVEDGIKDDTDDSDYSVTSDEERHTRKRKRSRSGSKHHAKKRQSEGGSQQLAPRAVSNPAPTTPVVPRVTPVQSLIYGFKCLWIVHHGGKPMKCSRKLVTYEESLDHLVSFHISKTVEWNLPLKCTWEHCPENKHEFPTAKDLRDHVGTHVDSDRHSNIRNTTQNVEARATQADRQQPGRSTAQLATPSDVSKSSVPSKPNGEVLPIVASGPPSPESEPPTPVHKPEENVTKSTRDHQDISWMTSVLYALTCTKLKSKNDAKCPMETSCRFCRLVTLNNELCEDPSPSTAMFQFISFQAKHQDPKGHSDPLTFIDTLFDAVVKDESHYHSSSTVKDAFWMKYIESDVLMCSEHPLNGNIVNLFPVHYKSCADCYKQTKHWPTELQGNLIIKLKAADNIHYPEVMSVKGRVYLLSAVVTTQADDKSAGDAYSAYVRNGDLWSRKHGDSVETITGAEQYNGKTACIVIYTEKLNTPDDEYAVAAPKMLDCPNNDDDFQNGSFMTKEDPASQIRMSVHYPSANSPCMEVQICEHQTKPALSETPECAAKEQVAGRLASAFMHRRILNQGNESCITSVLQVLLQTTLAHVPVEMCMDTAKCYLCNLISVSRRILLDRNGEPIPAYEFTLCKEVFGITTGEGNPGTYIGDVISAVVDSAKSNHNVSFQKYKFMIMLQKKSCHCRSSIETYHWQVSPEKKNEYLTDLLAKYRTFCKSCNIMAEVQPVQMPDNLVITVERNKQNPEASVQFPDEWACYDSRYFLSALIVRETRESEENDHFFAYCKIFGEWFRYNDGDVSGASFSDVLEKRACVLVYVTEELTMTDLQSILHDTKVYPFKAWHPTYLQLKHEPVD